VEELLDAYIRVNEIDALQSEYQGRSVNVVREIATMPWGTREFVVKDCDGRLLCFGQATDSMQA